MELMYHAKKSSKNVAQYSHLVMTSSHNKLAVILVREECQCCDVCWRYQPQIVPSWLPRSTQKISG
jgi:hypothetical protein